MKSFEIHGLASHIPLRKIIFFSAAVITLFPSGVSMAQNGLTLPGFGPPPTNTSLTPAPGEDESFDFLAADPSNPDEAFDFERSEVDLAEKTRQQAFDAALQGLLPLKPEEIRALLERFDRTQESVELPVYPAPRPEVAVETLSLDPGTKPTTIKVAHGYVTTFNVVDSTGAPWPIEDITWAGNFEIIESGTEAAHFIRITPQSEFAFGNMSMRLLGLQTPIILSLETSRDVVHYRFDAIVPETGPFAEAPLIQAGISIAAGDVDMAKVLEGRMPSGAHKLAVSGTDSRTSAYQYKGLTYLRTPLTLLSPAWISSTSSSDGMRVYAMSEAPVVLLSEHGKMVRARLSERGDITDE